MEKSKPEYVLLVPKDILTKDVSWISKNDFLNSDTSIFNAMENKELRFKINKFFESSLDNRVNNKGKTSKDTTKKSKRNALSKTVIEHPEIINYYLKLKEGEKQLAIKKILRM